MSSCMIRWKKDGGWHTCSKAKGHDGPHECLHSVAEGQLYIEQDNALYLYSPASGPIGEQVNARPKGQ